MPIKPENKARYPKDWPAIAAAIRARAGDRCEWPGCRVRQYSVGIWLPDATGAWAFQAMWGDTDEPRTYRQARQAAAEIDGIEGDGDKPIVIVLTVAHKDHQPENVADDNLAAWCQRHHLAYDHQHHRTNAHATRRARARTPDLFDEPPA